MLGALLLASVVPTRIDVAPAIDGALDDAVWTRVPATDRFTQSFPHDGAAPSHPTRLRVAYDDDNLYLAVDCEQSVAPVRRLTRSRHRRRSDRHRSRHRPRSRQGRRGAREHRQAVPRRSGH